MKIAVIVGHVPFVHSNMELLAETLKDRLLKYGQDSIVIKLPFNLQPCDKILDHILAYRLLWLENTDKVIALGFPAYYVKHRNKTVWLADQCGPSFDSAGILDRNLTCIPEGEFIRQAIVNADNRFLPEAKKIFTISSGAAGRLRALTGIESSILCPPFIEDTEYGDKSIGSCDAAWEDVIRRLI